LTPVGSVPALVFEDRERFLLCMEAVPAPHENWKERLLRGVVEPALVEQFGTLLGCIHEQSLLRRHELEPLFGDRSFFEALRLEPYYRSVARRCPSLASFMEGLIAETLAARVCLVHGDYSPKNILVREGRLVLLDHEVIHFGDPAFDIGFATAHLLSKALHLPDARVAFLGAAAEFSRAYERAAPVVGAMPKFRERAARHAVGCLLARVDGRSPLEYLSASEREQQRALTRQMVDNLPRDVLELVQGWGRLLRQP
jgi:tRNA A-37 threonylcarbamoyl transferase component Bud32